jgi:hypothetical protein
METRSILRYLVPSGAWLRRTVLLFSFVLLDYFVTLIFCRTPYGEGNLLARNFMETYGIFAGLTIFDLLMAAPVYAVMCIDSYFIRFTEKHSTKVELLVDLAIGWLIAGAHFNGAASWLWDAPNMLRQTLGLVIYEAAALHSFYPSIRLLNPHAFLSLLIGNGKKTA